MPVDVPSDRHNSTPVVPLVAAKYATSFKTTSPQVGQLVVAIPGLLPLVPGLISFTSAVPEAVPSENHSSAPSAAVDAIKKKPPETAPPKRFILM